MPQLDGAGSVSTTQAIHGWPSWSLAATQPLVTPPRSITPSSSWTWYHQYPSAGSGPASTLRYDPRGSTGSYLTESAPTPGFDRTRSPCVAVSTKAPLGKLGFGGSLGSTLGGAGLRRPVGDGAGRVDELGSAVVSTVGAGDGADAGAPATDGARATDADGPAQPASTIATNSPMENLVTITRRRSFKTVDAAPRQVFRGSSSTSGSGAPGRTRTADAGLRTASLCPLSYGGADVIVPRCQLGAAPPRFLPSVHVVVLGQVLARRMPFRDGRW